MDYERLSFVLSGKLRQDVVRCLEKPKTPTQLAQELRKQDASISRSLRELAEQKIAYNMFPEQRKGKMYALTKTGLQILRELQTRGE